MINPNPTNNPKDCRHEKFAARVHVQKFDDKVDELGNNLYMAEVQIHCSQCGTPFRFHGVPQGLDFFKPTVSITGTDLQVPLRPGPLLTIPQIVEGLTGFSGPEEKKPNEPATPERTGQDAPN